MIDNTHHEYIPIRLRRSGIYAMCRLDVVAHHDFLKTLDDDLIACLKILPSSVHPLIRRTRVWANQTYYVMGSSSKKCPETYNHTTTHHHEAWLIRNCDLPEKATGIEIYNINDYLRMRNHWNGCGLILHEFCHLIHQLVFGLDCPAIIDAYRFAEQSGKYSSVLRRDWAGAEQQCDLSYSMVDHKEFFAEMSVTYLAQCYRELDSKDCQSMADCCPPLTESNVLARLGVEQKSLSFLERILNYLCGPQHCNKFYPFTSGQLRHYDPMLHQKIEAFWIQIKGWRDPESTQPCCCWAKPMTRPLILRPLLESHSYPDTVLL